jgi:hypothetical protein
MSRLIRASGTAVEHITSAVLPFLESNLPTVVWWPGNFLLQPQPFTRLGAADAPKNIRLQPQAVADAVDSRCPIVAYWLSFVADVG